jgi:thiamine-phosphate pyrophosphorylase
MPKPFPALYAILDPEFTTLPLNDLAIQFADAGVSLMQLRAKRWSARRTYEQARELIDILLARGVTFIVNDRADIAAMTGSAGVHVGQEDIPAEDARRLCPAPQWVGVSTHNLDQLREASLTSADYIAVGPIFPTGAKENPDPVVGVEFVRQAREITPKPIVAIGGITAESAAEVFRAGADSVAVIRDLIAATDPAARAREYLAIADRTRLRRE